MRRPKLAVLGLLPLLLTACGGGGGSSVSASPSSPTSPQPVAFTTAQAASVVIGQPDFTTNTASVTSTGNGGSYGNPALLNGILYLGDYGYNRVLGYNSIPTSNGASANFVLGQTSFTGSTNGTAMNQMAGPTNAVAYNGDLYVDEYGGNRIDVYHPAPTAANSAPNMVSPMAISYTLTNTGCGGFSAPANVVVVAGKLIVADDGHSRILIWNTIPTSSTTPPDVVLGQTSCTGGTVSNQSLAAPSATTLSYPGGVWSDGTRLVVLDSLNNRILIWNTFPTSNDQAANLVLGQPTFAASTGNQGGAAPTAATLYDPWGGVWSNGLQLFVTDENNNRTLIWNSFPTANDQAADVVLGQPNMNSTATVAASATEEYYPSGLLLTGNQLIVADSSNYRYLIYTGQ